jgi:hypothetical protein
MYWGKGNAMLKIISIAISIFLLGLTGALAKDCSAVFKPLSTTGLVTRMTLYRFTDHYELQFLTPSQLPLLDMTTALDGTKQPVFLSGGLDDDLFMVTDDENGVAISQKTLDAWAKGRTLEIKGHDANDKAESAVFALNGLGMALAKMPKRCK